MGTVPIFRPISAEKMRKYEDSPPIANPKFPDFKFHYFSDFLIISNLELTG